MVTNNAHLTAISRKSLSTPAKYLYENNLLVGRSLDYGCGRGFDADKLGIAGFDPYHRPVEPTGLYDTIMCNFVANVIEDADDRAFLAIRILAFLAPGGSAYISVRNDRKNLNGTTTKGTWQGYVEYPFEVVKRTSGYVMYKVTAPQD